MGQKRRRKSWLRELVVAELQRGPAEDDKGKALQVLTDRVGHSSKMSVGNVVRLLELEGNAIRVTAKDGHAPRGSDGNPSPHVRRTYRVALTDEFIARLPPLPEPVGEDVESGVVIDEPAPEEVADAVAGAAAPFEADYELPEGIDYDLVAHAVLGVVFKNLTASQEVQAVRALRKDLVDTRAALGEAKHVIVTLGEQLEAERKLRGKVEAEAMALSVEVEALKAELRATTEKVDTRRTNGWELRDIISEQSAKELDRIMRAVPTTRG